MASTAETNAIPADADGAATAAQPGVHPVDVHSAVAEHAVELATARKDILRIATAGSVDDGKSTLIGRLLHDTKSILDDQLDQVELTSRERGATRGDDKVSDAAMEDRKKEGYF